MSHIETYSNNSLTIEVTEDNSSLHLKWEGKSIDRTPSDFIAPILSNVFKISTEYKKLIIMDFRSLELMNSSTITPISKLLERCKLSSTSIQVIYDKKKNWQDLSFSALKIFETDDKRIEITGKQQA